MSSYIISLDPRGFIPVAFINGEKYILRAAKTRAGAISRAKAFIRRRS